jgi:hypothetical protein
VYVSFSLVVVNRIRRAKGWLWLAGEGRSVKLTSLDVHWPQIFDAF